MRQEKLNEIIAEHAKWLEGHSGKRADLKRANLFGADLHEADLRAANMCYADLRHANLCGADLRYAYLCRADLRYANLHLANLEGAKLPDGVYQIVGAGSTNRCTTYDGINGRVICRCWDDEKGNHLDSFARRIEEIYGTNGEKANPMFYIEYMSAVEFFKTMGECVINTVLRG